VVGVEEVTRAVDDSGAEVAAVDDDLVNGGDVDVGDAAPVDATVVADDGSDLTSARSASARSASVRSASGSGEIDGPGPTAPVDPGVLPRLHGAIHSGTDPAAGWEKTPPAIRPRSCVSACSPTGAPSAPLVVLSTAPVLEMRTAKNTIATKAGIACHHQFSLGWNIARRRVLIMTSNTALRPLGKSVRTRPPPVARTPWTQSSQRVSEVRHARRRRPSVTLADGGATPPNDCHLVRRSQR
jgi:hypothetical protein